LEKYVEVVFDEVKFKEGIVYNKHECRIVGFVDFGDVNNALLAFERSMNGDADRTMAKQMLVFNGAWDFYRSPVSTCPISYNRSVG